MTSPAQPDRNQDADASSLSGAANGEYEIRVRGQLDGGWSDWLDGMQMECTDGGEMILRGLLQDQAALNSVLNRIYSLNLSLISVEKRSSRTQADHSRTK